MNKVHEYILSSWNKSVINPLLDNKNPLPNEYLTPTIGGVFSNFYYWDTYFINVGLLVDNQIELARKNLNIMKYFVNKIGFVPNADHLTFGSQPPLFSRGVFDLYNKSKDINDIKNYIDELIIEMKFWREKRNTEIGLNQYKCGFPDDICLRDYGYWNSRVGGFSEEENKLGKVFLSKDMFAIAESGWDTNSRYLTKTNRFAIHQFVGVDLNSILYDAEMKISEMLQVINREKEAKEFLLAAKNRLELINKYLLNDEKIYLDYNFINKSHSSILSIASLYPYAFNVSDDKQHCLQVFNELIRDNGIASSNKGKFQWDGDIMWPPTVYIAYLALKNVKAYKEANELKHKYIKTIEKVYKESNQLWEKYDPVNGDIAHNDEYVTPPMLGWTAGVYEYFYMEKDL